MNKYRVFARLAGLQLLDQRNCLSPSSIQNRRQDLAEAELTPSHSFHTTYVYSQFCRLFGWTF